MAASTSVPPPSPRPERFGNFVLLTETERSWLATEYRAAHLGDSGFDRLVQLVRFTPASKAGAPDTLVEHVKAAMKVGGAGVLRALGTGRNGAGWLSYEYNPGHSLRAVLERAREEGFPLALDNALEIARQVCLTLEKAHARTLPGGAPLVHGCLAPWSVVVSYDGAVRLRGFGLWAGRALGALPPEEAGMLAPEQAEQRADVRTDVYGLGALVLSSLRSAPLPGGTDPRSLVAETTTAEGDPLPPQLAATIERALSPRPEVRHQTAAEFRQELETLLFAGEVAPTTFNLAFFMETLYRGTVEDDARAVEAETRADYSPYLRPATPEAASVPETPAESKPLPPAIPVVPPPVVPAVPASVVPAVPPPRAETRAPAPAEPLEAPAIAPAPPERVRPATAPSPSRMPVIAGAAAALVLVAGGAFYFLKVRQPAAPAAPAPTTLSAEAQAAVARVQELEARLKALEEERLQAEAAAAETARQRMEAEAKARGKAVDPRALERAQEEAARKVRLQEEKRQEEERQQLERRKREEQARLAAAAPPPTVPPASAAPATVVAAASAAPEAPPTMVAEAAPEPVASAAPAPTPDVYEFGAAGVIPPSMLSQPPLEYPIVARASRITGSVTVAAVVDEQGRVISARATSGNPVLRKAAVDHIKARKYRPATKDGAPVKIQLIVQVNFKG